MSRLATQAAHSTNQADGESTHDDIIYPGAVPFVLVHLICFTAIFWTGVTLESVVIGIVLYWVRMVGVTGGYHRYFSHRSYKTSRAGQFVIAALAQSSAQRGAIWWAAMHRHHHQYSDLANDTHSPRHHGFLYAHLGWIFSKKNSEPNYESVADLMAYPELVWLNKHQYVVPAILGFVVWLIAGWPGFVVGFLWSTVLCWHGTFFINSLAHVHGTQRYLTGDDSRNNWWLAILTCGEGWHNNHHAYQSSTRQGFRWYQVDFTYYVLKVISWTGLIWDLRDPPADVINNERKLGRLVVEKVARQVADTYSPDGVAAQVRSAWENSQMWPDVQAWARSTRAQTVAKVAPVQLPELPTAQDIRNRAAEKFRVPEVSLDEVSERARILLIQAVSSRILGEEHAAA